MENFEEERIGKGEIENEEDLSFSEIRLLNLIAEIIVNVSIREFNEKKSDSISEV